MNRGKSYLTIAFIGIGLIGGACFSFASSPDAWENFRRMVHDACEKQVATTMIAPEICEDPYGSESYGVAIASGVSRETHEELMRITIYDKRTKKAETTIGFKMNELPGWRQLIAENQRLKQEIAQLKKKVDCFLY